MAANTSSYSDEEADALITDINVTPLVDIVLVLLIVFMITMPTIVAAEALKERELSVILPQASEARPLTAKPKEVFVNVDADGNYIVRQARLSEQKLLQLLQQADADNPGRATVIIRADRRCPWQFVAAVMNLCNKAGIKDYRVGTAQ
jgi:biopolymer transport protein ExbD